MCTDLRSPIDRIRGELGISMSELSLLSGTRYSDLHNARAGRIRLPKRFLMWAESIGYSSDTLEGEQEEYLSVRRKALAARVEASIGSRGTGLHHE